jgi:hypothetical protein
MPLPAGKRQGNGPVSADKPQSGTRSRVYTAPSVVDNYGHAVADHLDAAHGVTGEQEFVHAACRARSIVVHH